jgi:hypothetical protein
MSGGAAPHVALFFPAEVVLVAAAPCVKKAMALRAAGVKVEALHGPSAGLVVIAEKTRVCGHQARVGPSHRRRRRMWSGRWPVSNAAPPTALAF